MSYTGNSAYCYSNSLHMCLHQAGMKNLPDVGTIECFTGMPFGTTYLNFDYPLFFPNPAKTDPHLGLTQALKTLGWTCDYWEGSDIGEAQQILEDAIEKGPVLIGPVDMSLLTYDPNHEFKTGGDHFVVILAISDGMVEIHDPQFYPFTILPLVQLMRAWDATNIGYADKAFTLRHSFQEQSSVSAEKTVETALKIIKDLQGDKRAGPVVFTGLAAFKKAIDLIRPEPTPDFAGLLINFILPLGARRNHDAMKFMTRADENALAQLYREKSRLFGKSQYYAATKNWVSVIEMFESLAEIEDDLMNKIYRKE